MKPKQGSEHLWAIGIISIATTLFFIFDIWVATWIGALLAPLPFVYAFKHYEGSDKDKRDGNFGPGCSIMALMFIYTGALIMIFLAKALIAQDLSIFISGIPHCIVNFLAMLVGMFFTAFLSEKVGN